MKNKFVFQGVVKKLPSKFFGGWMGGWVGGLLLSLAGYIGYKDCIKNYQPKGLVDDDPHKSPSN